MRKAGESRGTDEGKAEGKPRVETLRAHTHTLTRIRGRSKRLKKGRRCCKIKFEAEEAGIIKMRAR